MRSSEVAFRLESPVEGAEQLRALAEAFPTAPENLPPQDRVFFDTFDWRIYRAGGSITKSTAGGRPRIEWRRGRGRPLVLEAVAALHFAGDLPAGEARDALAKVIEVRRLLPVVKITSRREGLRILNTDQKTVARVRLEERFAAAGKGSRRRQTLAPLLRLIPVRGYDREMRRVEKLLVSRLGPAGEPPLELESALEAIGTTPGGYSSKLALRLSPTTTAEVAARQIHRALLEMIVANEPGLRADLDIEFLHDFRVAVRRARTALGQIRHVLQPTAVGHFKREFAWLGGLTGLSRDLDVFLLRMEGYRESLPDSARGDLGPLETYVRRRRTSERRGLTNGLDSPRFRALTDDWRRFLERDAPAEDLPADAERPVLEVADKNIRRVYRKVLQKGAAITDETPAEALHRLRIDCKKLRYLLEFFRSLYPESEIGPVIGELKRLQDNLGDFNDFAVQQEMMKRLADGLGKKRPAPVGTLMAIGRLVGHLEEGEAEARRHFAARFGRFASPKSRRLFRRLLEGHSASRGSG